MVPPLQNLDPDAFDRLIAMAKASLAQEARELVAKIHALRREGPGHEHPIGQALRGLTRPGLGTALGHASFDELCEREFGWRSTKTDTLMRLAATLSAEQCKDLGPDRADAVAGLVRLLSAEAKAALLAGAAVTLWDGGPQVALAGSSGRALRSAAKQLRAHLAGQEGQDASPGQPSRRPCGRTVTREERAEAEALETELRGLGMEAQIRALATKPGQPACFRIDGLSLGSLVRLVRGLRATRPTEPLAG